MDGTYADIGGFFGDAGYAKKCAAVAAYYE